MVETDNQELLSFLHFNDFQEAEKAYIRQYAELSTTGNSSSNLLLFHAQQPDFNTISLAYSNYFLTYNELFYRLISYRKDFVIRDFDLYVPYPFVKNAFKLLNLTQTIAGNFSYEIIQFALSKPDLNTFLYTSINPGIFKKIGVVMIGSKFSFGTAGAFHYLCGPESREWTNLECLQPLPIVKQKKC